MKTLLLLLLLAAATRVFAQHSDLVSAPVPAGLQAHLASPLPPIFAVARGAGPDHGAPDVFVDLEPLAREFVALCGELCASRTAVRAVPGALLRPVGRLAKLVQGGLTLRSNDRGRLALQVGRTGLFASLPHRAGWTVRFALNW